MTKITYIPGEIANAAIDEHGKRKPVTRTQYIFDDAKGKSQAEVNKEFGNAIGGLNSQNYVTVDSFNALPATGTVDTVYRVSNWDGSQQDTTVYSEYAWNGSQYVHLSTKTQIGEVFDISAYHATGGELVKYADLAAALDSNNGGGVPQSFQKGGMRIQFVRTSDNKYVQWRCMAQNFTTDVTQWQGVDDEPTAGSENLVKSGSVYKKNSEQDLLIYKSIEQVETLPAYTGGPHVYKEIYGLDFSSAGKKYILSFGINNNNPVRLYKTIDSNRTKIGDFRNGSSTELSIEAGMTAIEIEQGGLIDMVVTVTIINSESLSNKIDFVETSLNKNVETINSNIGLLKSGEEYLDFQWEAGTIVNGEEAPSSYHHRSRMFTMEELLFAKLVLSNSSYLDFHFYDASDSYVFPIRKASDWVIVPENARFIKVRFVIQNSFLNDDDVSIILNTNIGSAVRDNSFNVERHSDVLAKNVGLIRDTRFVRGNITANLDYTSSNTICTLDEHHVFQAKTIHLNSGDIVGLDDFSIAKLRLVKYVNGEYSSLTNFYSSEHTVSEDGDYAFVIRKSEEGAIVDNEIETLSSLFYIKTVDGYAKRIDTIETELWDDLPSYFKTQIDSKTDTIKTALDTAGRNKCAFIFVTDQHWSANEKHSPAIIRYLTKNIPTIKTVFGGGDITSNGQDKSKIYWQFMDYQKKMDFLLMKIMQSPGNHDFPYKFNPTPLYWTDGERYIGCMGQMVNNHPVVVGTEEGSYHFYYDSPFERTRIIYLSTGNYDACATKGQLEFVRDALLSTPEGWHIIIMTHIIANPVPPDPENPDEWGENAPTKRGFYVTDYTYKFLDMADAYNNRTTYSALPYGSSTPVSCDFSNGVATFEGAVGGHLHADVWGKTHGNHGFIITDTDGNYPLGDYTFTKGTVSEQCVSVIIFDFSNRNIKMFRIGRGVDMTIDLDNPTPMEYQGVPLQKS